MGVPTWHRLCVLFFSANHRSMGSVSNLVILVLVGALVIAVYLLLTPSTTYTPTYLTGSKACGLLPTELVYGVLITADPAAKWIGTSGATPQTFNNIQVQILYTNKTKTEQEATLTWAVDDVADIYIGGNKVGSGAAGFYGTDQTGFLKNTLYFPPGNHLVRFNVSNSRGGRGGMIASCRSTAAGTPLLFSSGTSWKVRDNPAS
jgi:hypothetical protein